MNNPFDEFMDKSLLSDETKKELAEMGEDVKQILLVGILAMSGLDPFILDIFKDLMKNGCPADAIIKTMESQVLKAERKEKKDE